jgi:hypothetical protein
MAEVRAFLSFLFVPHLYSELTRSKGGAYAYVLDI